VFKDSLGRLTQKQDLTAEELTEFVEAMRDEQVTDVQIAGFLVALLMKGPTVDEVAAIARAMRANCVQIQPDVDGNLTDMCGTGGGLTTFNVSSANAILTAAGFSPRVVPFDMGGNAGMDREFRKMDFPNGEQVVFLGQGVSAIFFDDTRRTESFRRHASRLISIALDPKESVHLVATIMKEHQ